jgi:hypothetical protein
MQGLTVNAASQPQMLLVEVDNSMPLPHVPTLQVVPLHSTEVGVPLFKALQSSVAADPEHIFPIESLDPLILIEE